MPIELGTKPPKRGRVKMKDEKGKIWLGRGNNMENRTNQWNKKCKKRCGSNKGNNTSNI